MTLNNTLSEHITNHFTSIEGYDILYVFSKEYIIGRIANDTLPAFRELEHLKNSENGLVIDNEIEKSLLSGISPHAQSDTYKVGFRNWIDSRNLAEMIVNGYGNIKTYPLYVSNIYEDNMGKCYPTEKATIVLSQIFSGMAQLRMAWGMKIEDDSFVACLKSGVLMSYVNIQLENWLIEDEPAFTYDWNIKDAAALKAYIKVIQAKSQFTAFQKNALGLQYLGLYGTFEAAGTSNAHIKCGTSLNPIQLSPLQPLNVLPVLPIDARNSLTNVTNIKVQHAPSDSTGNVFAAYLVNCNESEVPSSNLENIDSWLLQDSAATLVISERLLLNFFMKYLSEIFNMNVVATPDPKKYNFTIQDFIPFKDASQRIEFDQYTSDYPVWTRQTRSISGYFLINFETKFLSLFFTMPTTAGTLAQILQLDITHEIKTYTMGEAIVLVQKNYC